jgi:DNA-directed RNA polymerase specialized sigma24 family protein
MATSIVLDPSWSDETTVVGTFLQERSTEFDARFFRCYGLLHFVACRVLKGSEGVEEAIENCRVKASQNPPDFEHEGAFRSWLVRILMDEALAARRRTRID